MKNGRMGVLMMSYVSETSDLLTSMMMMRICSRIMSMRRKYGDRRSMVIRRMTTWSSQTSRRERARKIRMTSRRMFRHRLNGKLRREDLEDIRELDRVVKECRGDFEISLRCLREATFYVDDLVVNPKLVKDLRYRVWAQALDCFLSEMRSLVEMKERPRIPDTDIVESLIWRLSMMRINETLEEQMEVRQSLEDAVESLFTLKKNQRKRLRTTGC